MLEQLETSDDFEIQTNSGNKILMPLMDEYPNAQNTFDVFASNDGETTGDDNAGTPTKRTMSAEQQQAVADTIGAVAQVGASLLANRDETKMALKTRCGRKPIFGKDKKRKYQECKENFYKDMQQANANVRTDNSPPPPPPPPPPRGLSTGAVVGIVLGVVALGVGGYFIFKRGK